VLAAAGLLLIFLVTDGSVTVKGVLLALAGAFCWALSNFVVKEARTPQMLGFLVWSCLFAPLPLFGISYCQHDAAYIVSQIQQLRTPVWLALLYQVYVATLFGYTVWNELMRRYSVSQVAPLSLMVPVFGMSLSAWLFAEALGAQKLLAATLVLLGLLINVFGPRLLNRLLQPHSV
jgi:O-acetylserine/cysteine efflux transporter